MNYWNPRAQTLFYGECFISTLRAILLTIACFLSVQAIAEREYKTEKDASLPELWRWRAIPELNEAGFHCMTEAADGTLWFGVDEGILQYDGLRWTVHRKEQGFTDSVVYSICITKDGSIYAASNNSIFRYHAGTWEKILLKDNASFALIRTLVPSPRGGVWIASNDGAFYLQDGDITFFDCTKEGSNFSALSKVDRVIEYPEKLKPASQGVFNITEDRQGHVWFIHNREILRYNLQSRMEDESAWKMYRLDWSKGIRFWPRNAKVYETQDGTLWLVSRVAQYTLNRDEKWIPTPDIDREEVHNEVWDFLQSRNGQIVMVSDKYLHAKSPDGWLNLELPRLDKLKTTLFEDSRGFLWMAKERGSVFCIDNTTQRWRSFKGLEYQFTEKNGTRWFINDRAEVVRQQGEQWTAYNAADGLIDAPYRVIQAKDGSVWVSGSHNQQAATSVWINDAWSRKVHKNVGVSFEPGATVAASNGNLYFGASNYRLSLGGVICATPTADGYQYSHNRLGETVPRWTKSMVEDASQNIWVCGAYIWKGDAAEFKRQPLILEGERSSLHSNLAVTDHGEIWLARRGKGIFRQQGDHWEPVNTGLPEKFIHSMLCDGETTWISSISGVSRFQDTSWATRLFSDDFPEKGLQIEAVRKENDNTYWFNIVPYKWTIDVRAKQYANLTTNDFKCVQYIPQLEPPDTTIEFSAKQVDSSGNTIIEWKGISPWHATQAENLYYSYRINEGTWSPFSKDTSVTLLALKSGGHTFEVRARDDDFNVDPTPAIATFQVALPVWRQGWFIVLLCVVIILIIMVLRSYKHRLVIEQQHKTELERVKLRFFTSISHELRTPLTVLLGPLQSMYKKTQDPETKSGLQMMIRNGEKLRTLINQILDFRKLEAGKMKIYWHRGDFIQSAQTIHDSLLTYAEMASVTCSFEAPTASCMVWFDPDKLQILLSNLITNAVKYSPAGGNVNVLVHIDYQKDDAGKTIPSAAVIRVEDAGPGIPAEHQDHIFERYYRSDSNDNKGSGLGLALVKDLTELLGGAVLVESPLTGGKQGTAFILQLPLHFDAPEGAESTHIQTEYNLLTPEAIPERSPSEQTEKPSILIVDDDEDIRSFIRAELSPFYATHEASNGQEGLESASELMPDLIISDVMMPLMDGTQLCAELKDNPSTSHIPIILLTARASLESELEGVHAGADAYVTKPFSMDLLKARVHGLLEARRAMRERFSQEIELADFDVSITSIDQVFLERAIDNIKKRMDDFEFGPKQLAQEINMNERTLQIKIKTITGETPSTLIRLMRLKCAKKLMEEATPGLTVGEVASAVGMIDVSYFGKVFKKQFGETPSAFMAKNKK